MAVSSLTVILGMSRSERQNRACLEHLFQYTDMPFRLVIGSLVPAGKGGQVLNPAGLLESLKVPDDVEIIRLPDPDASLRSRFCNRAYSLVMPGSHVALMDTGVLVPNRWASRLLSHFGDADRVGAVGPVGSRMGQWQDFAIWFGEARYDPEAWPLDPRFHQFSEQVYQDQRDWFHTAKALSGACLVIGPGVFERVGGFREEVPPPWGEIDWCLRTRLEGYELVVADDVYVWRGENESDQPQCQWDPGDFERHWSAISGGLSLDDLVRNDREIPRPLYSFRQRRTIKLDLGAGEAPRPGYIALDLRPLPHVQVVCDIRHLPYPNDSVDAINAGEVLEHFGRAEVEPLLKEWIRVLKPGGEFTVRVPDFGEICRRYAEGKASCGLANLWIFGGQSHPLDFHKVGFDLVDLTIYLQRAGFVRIKRLPEIPNWNHHPRLHLQAFKP